MLETRTKLDSLFLVNRVQRRVNIETQISYAAIKLFTGRAREVHWMVWIIAGLFLFKFAYIGGH